MRYSDPRDNEVVDVDVKVTAISQKAIRVATDDEGDGVWLPRSQCVFGGQLERGDHVTIGVQRWLAEREGLV